MCDSKTGSLNGCDDIKLKVQINKCWDHFFYLYIDSITSAKIVLALKHKLFLYTVYVQIRLTKFGSLTILSATLIQPSRDSPYGCHVDCPHLSCKRFRLELAKGNNPTK